MAGLTVAGTDFECESFEELEPLTKGELTRTFNGTGVTTISTEKRRFRAVTSPVNKTKFEAMESAFALGASFTVTGNLLLGDSVTCRGRFTATLAGIGSLDAGYNHVYRLTFMLEQA
jgi:hypothetical protein